MRAEGIFKKTPPMLLHRVEVTLARPLDEEGIEIWTDEDENEVRRSSTILGTVTNMPMLVRRIVAPRASRVRLVLDQTALVCDEIASLGEDLAADIVLYPPLLIRCGSLVSLRISLREEPIQVPLRAAVREEIALRRSLLQEQRIIVCELWGLFLTDAQAQDLLARHEGP